MTDKEKRAGTQVTPRRVVFLLLDDFARFVGSANFANAVRQLQLAALIASDHARHDQLEVRAALVLAGFRCFAKRDCHVPTSLSE
jgi:hypothetical protein